MATPEEAALNRQKLWESSAVQANWSGLGVAGSLTSTSNALYGSWGGEATPSLGSISLLYGVTDPFAKIWMSADDFVPGASATFVYCPRVVCAGVSIAPAATPGGIGFNEMYMIGLGWSKTPDPKEMTLPKTAGAASATATVKLHGW